MTLLFIQLFANFFFIGLLTIGGGYAMIPLIRHQVVSVNHWISDGTLTDIIAISQMTPGPVGINSATYIGYSVIREAGGNQFLAILGSFTSTAAVMLPSIIIMLVIVKMYFKLKDNMTFKNTMSGIKPVVVGLIGAAAVILMTKDNFPDWKSWIIFVSAFVGLMWIKLNPLLIIATAGVIGLVLY